jgi:hypothetical protein
MTFAILCWTAAAILLLGGVALIAWALLWDRARGRARCPACWYDLASLVRGASLPTCPECGRAPRRAKQLYRTRRRWRWAAAALLPMAGGLCLAAWPAVRADGYTALIPTTVLYYGVFGGYIGSTSSLHGELAYNRFTNDRFLPGERPLLTRDALNRLRTSNNPEHRKRAASLLGWIGGRDPRITPALMNAAAHDRATGVRAQALRCLGNYRADPARVVPLLIDIIRSDPDDEIRGWALGTLRTYGPAAQQGIPVVLELIHGDPAADLTGSAVFAVAAIGTEGPLVVPRLIELLRDGRLSGQVLPALEELGPQAAPAVPEIIAVLQAGGFYAGEAERTLGLIGPPAAAALPILQAIMNDPSALAISQYNAARAIEVIQGRYAIAAAHVAQLDDPYRGTRLAAAQELRRLAFKNAPFTADVIQAVIDAMHNEPDPAVSDVLAHAISLLPGAHEDPIITALRRYAREDSGFGKWLIHNLRREESRRLPPKQRPSP